MGPVARHPKYLLETLSVSEVNDWKNHFYSNPFGIDQVMWLMVQMWADWLNAHRGEGTAEVHPSDLMPTSDLEKRWSLIEREIEAQFQADREQRMEQRRLAKMSQQQRNDELMTQLLRSHAARMGKPTD